MKNLANNIIFSPTDLSGHIACNRLTYLNYAASKGLIEVPEYRDPMLVILQERGREFESSYLKTLEEQGLKADTAEPDKFEDSLARTIALMHAGTDVIYQASLKKNNWQGRADFLLKVDKPSNIGTWSYEVLDSKLAKDTRTGTILQLCSYSEMVAEIQGVMPEFMHVITPENGFSRHEYRIDDFSAYYRYIKKHFEDTIKGSDGSIPVYPDPCPHCEICNWWKECDDKRRSDDHLSLVAGLSKSHAAEIKKWNVHTLEQLAQVPLPLPQKPSRGATETFIKLREQARVQLESRRTNKPVYEYLDVIDGKGFFKMPTPSSGDIFFDLESDPFAGISGLEYLFGWIFSENSNNYYFQWALTQEDEKKAFETFVDMVMQRWKQFPDLHIYHFTAFEPAALKRLMGKYATRENEIDQMLRANLFVDLHSITKQAIRAGIENYSLKELEKFHEFDREVELRHASAQLRTIESFIERNDINNIPEETLNDVANYNKEDCLSTKNLRDWLEHLREKLIAQGHQISRLENSDGSASEALTEHQQKIKGLYDALIAGIPIDNAERTRDQQAYWLIANMLDWYRREKKATWWEYFRLCDLPDDELIEEKSALAGLKFTGHRVSDKKSVIDQYSFPFQECEIREGDELKTGDGNSFGKVSSINTSSLIIEIRKGPKIVDIHPTSIFKHTEVPDQVKEEAIIKIASWILNNGINASGLYRAGRDLLLNSLPRTKEKVADDAAPQRKAVTWARLLDGGVLPIQGPPGTGKSHTASQMILALVKSGKKIGITALSHKVITGLMQKVVKLANEQGAVVSCLRKVTSLSDQPDPQIAEETKNEKIISAIQNGSSNIIGGTPWLWAREDMSDIVDVLFVDEAGQLSLIDTVAVSQSCKNLVLLGDPQQLKQPQQGSHPEGTEVSALEHILGEHQTIPLDRGIFLDFTWRLHPNICSFVSELFYDNRLTSKPELINQQLEGNNLLSGAGLWFEPVIHEGNQNSSPEEVNVVSKLIKELVKGDVFYIDNQKQKKVLDLGDIKVISPYNAQVSALQTTLPTEVQVGTVDKFQGQEAPVIIFSMATSTPEDAPRGMEFLYSLNRLNVAVSRAKSTFILVASPKLFEPNCNNIGQMKLANAFCRFLEVAN